VRLTKLDETRFFRSVTFFFANLLCACAREATMASRMETRHKETSGPIEPRDGEVPSGFILKLYQMVNGAPDEVIAVSFITTVRSFVHLFSALYSND
jgi:hypothetical protein